MEKKWKMNSKSFVAKREMRPHANFVHDTTRGRNLRKMPRIVVCLTDTCQHFGWAILLLLFSAKLCKYVSSPVAMAESCQLLDNNKWRSTVAYLFYMHNMSLSFDWRVKVQKPLRPCNCNCRMRPKQLANTWPGQLAATSAATTATATALPATHFSRPKVLEAFCCPLRDEGLSVSLSSRQWGRQAATKRLRHTSDCRFCRWRVLLQLQLPSCCLCCKLLWLLLLLLLLLLLIVAFWLISFDFWQLS